MSNNFYREFIDEIDDFEKNYNTKNKEMFNKAIDSQKSLNLEIEHV